MFNSMSAREPYVIPSLSLFLNSLAAFQANSLHMSPANVISLLRWFNSNLFRRAELSCKNAAFMGLTSRFNVD